MVVSKTVKAISPAPYVQPELCANETGKFSRPDSPIALSSHTTALPADPAPLTATFPVPDSADDDAD